MAKVLKGHKFLIKSYGSHGSLLDGRKIGDWLDLYKTGLEAHSTEKNRWDVSNDEHDPTPKPGRIDLLFTGTYRNPDVVCSFLSRNGKHHFLSSFEHIRLYKARFDG